MDIMRQVRKGLGVFMMVLSFCLSIKLQFENPDTTQIRLLLDHTGYIIFLLIILVIGFIMFLRSVSNEE